jgi:hypothetical protein
MATAHAHAHTHTRTRARPPPPLSYTHTHTKLAGIKTWVERTRDRGAKEFREYRLFDWFALLLPCLRWLRTYKLKEYLMVRCWGGVCVCVRECVCVCVCACACVDGEVTRCCTRDGSRRYLPAWRCKSPCAARVPAAVPRCTWPRPLPPAAVGPACRHLCGLHDRAAGEGACCQLTAMPVDAQQSAGGGGGGRGTAARRTVHAQAAHTCSPDLGA